MTSLILEEATEPARLVGSPVRRTEDTPYITGRAQYVDDIKLPHCYHIDLLRSPYPHAKIVSIDLSRLADAPGFIAALTGEEMKRSCKPIFNWLPLRWLKTSDTYPLAVDKVRFVGEPVVAVVCDTKANAKDALDLISVEYETLPNVTDSEDAMQPDAPLLYDEWGDNIMLHYTFKAGDVERAFNEADLVVKERISCHRHSPVPLETNAYLATYNPTQGLTFWATTQHPHVLRTIIAETIGIPESSIRVIQPDVGGGFGGKSLVHAEEILVSFMAVRLKAPVKYVEERIDHMKASHQAREQTHYIEVAVKKPGEILAVRDKIIANLGIYYPTSGPSSAINASRFVTGCYRIENLETEVIGAATNKPPYGAYRGFGKDAASYVIERVMDIVAKRLGMDPIELRMRNIVPKEEFPYRSVTGALIDSGDYALCLKNLMEAIDYKRLRQEQSELRKNGRYLGIGISLVLEPASSHVPNSSLIGYDGSTVRLEPSGEISILTGVTSSGTGTKTVFAQIAADELGVPLNKVSVIQGDSNVCPYGFGMWASRGIVVGGNSVLIAARQLRRRIIMVAAHILERDPSDITIKDGVITSRRNARLRLTLKDVAYSFYRAIHPLPRELIQAGLEETVYYFPHTVESVPDEHGRRNSYATYGNSACAAIVECDPETGMIKILRYLFVGDAGRVINPLILEGQIQGGVVQGIGGAIYEENVYDKNGQPLAATLMDYVIPGAMESPDVEIRHIETISTVTALGAKGAGEGPIEGVYGTLANAVEDALSPFNIRIGELPLTPEKIWSKLRPLKMIA